MGEPVATTVRTLVAPVAKLTVPGVKLVVKLGRTLTATTTEELLADPPAFVAFT